MAVDALSLNSDKKIALPDLAAIVMRSRKDLVRVGDYAVVETERPVIACNMSLRVNIVVLLLLFVLIVLIISYAGSVI